MLHYHFQLKRQIQTTNRRRDNAVVGENPAGKKTSNTPRNCPVKLSQRQKYNLSPGEVN